MGQFKPFLFGTVFGLGTAFVALQFHLVQSHEGFRLVPRTPQPSIGLAYADIRNWTADEWADRPELARALVAHGSTDLVATSVSGGLMETISSDGSTLGKLRGLMNDSAETIGADSLSEQPGLLVDPRDAEADSEAGDIFSIPFPQAARKTTTRSATTQDDYSGKPSPSIARRELPSIDDILGSNVNSPGDIRPLKNAMPDRSGGTSTSRSAGSETEALEELLFGDESMGANRRRDAGVRSGVFEDISGEVPQRPQETLNKAGTGIRGNAGSAVTDTANSLDRYMRERVQERVPGSVSTMFGETDTAGMIHKPDSDADLPPALKAIRDGFDPFVR